MPAATLVVMSQVLPRITDIFESSGLHIQQTGYSCGPASLINAMRILRSHESASEKEIMELAKTAAGEGTDRDELTRAAESLGLEVVRAEQGVTNKQLRRHVSDGDCVIVNYCLFPQGGHYSIVAEYDEHGLYLWDCSYGMLRLNWKRFGALWVAGDDDTVKRWALVLR